MRVELFNSAVETSFDEICFRMLSEHYGHYGRPWGANPNGYGMAIEEGGSPFAGHPVETGDSRSPAELAADYLRACGPLFCVSWLSCGGNLMEFRRTGRLIYVGRRHALGDFLRFLPLGFAWQDCEVIRMESKSDACFWVAGVTPRS